MMMKNMSIKTRQLSQTHVHFIGIGGIGMCGLAELLHNMGAQVTGSDLKGNSQTQRLSQMGVAICLGHEAQNVGKAEVVVYSSAVSPQNVEYREARSRGIPLIPRAEALAEMMRVKRGIAIGGTHGKTTTTSMTASVFIEAQVDPTIVVGGRLDVIKSTAQLGQGEWLIAEADESDGSFNRLSPEIVVITNIDNDHLDHYQDISQLKKAFYEFASRVPFFGVVFVCGDDPMVKEVFIDFPKRIVRYGFNTDNDVILEGEKGQYKVFVQSHALSLSAAYSDSSYAVQDNSLSLLGILNVPMPGRHNALNALVSVLTGMAAGIDFSVGARGIQGFRGVDRRFQKIGEAEGVLFYDDYGHHPTEVAAVLSAFREKFPRQRLVVLFQPHRFSRTQLCWEQFLTCFREADVLYVADIYSAGEEPRAEISSSHLVKQMHHPQVEYIKLTQSDTDSTERLSKVLKEGDVFITLGAGDVWKWGGLVLQRWRNK